MNELGKDRVGRLWVSIRGKLDKSLLQGAVEQLVGRHEVLRTHFREAPGLSFPLQVIDRPLLDWSERADSSDKSTSDAPFDLEMGPLVRFQLLCRSATDHVLLVANPEIVVDRPSLH